MCAIPCARHEVNNFSCLGIPSYTPLHTKLFALEQVLSVTCTSRYHGAGLGSVKMQYILHSYLSHTKNDALSINKV